MHTRRLKAVIHAKTFFALIRDSATFADPVEQNKSDDAGVGRDLVLLLVETRVGQRHKGGLGPDVPVSVLV